jgi:hypothetical protein
MDSDDAPHAGDDSGKHCFIFAGKWPLSRRFGAKALNHLHNKAENSRRKVKKLESAASFHSGQQAQIGANPFC